LEGVDDSAARQRVRTSLDESLLIEAAAGTGKTTELVARLVAVLRRGHARVDQVAALTFTHKAAGELKLRLRRELDAARLDAARLDAARLPAAPLDAARLDAARPVADDDAARGRELRNLEDALARLEDAHVDTIHAFCARLLRERPVEAGIDPGFVGLEEEQARALYDRAFRGWIERRLDDLPPGLRRALARLVARGKGADGSALDALADAGWGLVEWRDFPAPWTRDPAFDRESMVDQLVSRLSTVAGLRERARSANDELAKALNPAVELAEWIARSEELTAGARDYDALEARLLQLLIVLRRLARRGKGRGPYGEGVVREAVVAARDELLTAISAFAAACDADLAALLQGELAAVTARYEELKRAQGALDFNDLLLRTRDLLRNSAGARPWLQERFRCVFVDEFQDTDPLQVEIILLLVADDPTVTDWRHARPRPGSLVLVGDPKQSIYRFRRADVVLYQEVADHLGRCGVGRVELSRNFRSTPPIQDLVNAAFAPRQIDSAALAAPLPIVARGFTEDRLAGQPGYVPLAPSRLALPSQPSVVALPVPRPLGGYGGVTNAAIEASLPAAVAAFVAWLVRDSGWTVADPEGGERRVPVAPHHVCLLFRRFVSWQVDLSRDYVEALEAHGLPYVLQGSRSFHQREEVAALRVAAQAVEWPDDEIAVYATLRGPFCAASDDQLFRARHLLGRLHPFRPLPAELPADLAPVAEGLTLLAELHRQRNTRPYASTLGELLRFGRAHAGFALRPAGHQALAHVQQVLDVARRAEQGDALSFRAFVEGLATAAEKGAATLVASEGSEAEGVRLLTLHAAKGLEFPVVVLVDLSAGLTHERPERHVDAARGLCALRLKGLGLTPAELLAAEDLEHTRDEAEGVRVAYVAATRARDLLVVTTVGSEDPAKRHGEPRWLDPLLPALYPARPFLALPEVAAGCPPFGDATVVADPSERVTSVRPGLQRPALGAHGVVWWDPAVLPPARDGGRRGLRFEELLSDQDPVAAAASRAAYDNWRTGRDAALAAGSRPTVEVCRPVEAPPPPDELVALVELVALERPPERPRGTRFGTLVHAVLEHAPLAADGRVLAELAGFHGRLLGATPDEVAHAAQAAAGALAAAVMREALTATRRHREVPVLVPFAPEPVAAPAAALAAGGAAPRLVEGVIDLAFVVDGGWTVVDFKTDAEVRGSLALYRRQVAWYLWALTRATGLPARRGVLLAV
jgi:ATP-dependent exoDNAse (exonuclease V) beta subunit